MRSETYKDLLRTLLILSWSSVCTSYVFRECGGRLNNSRGIIQSPNFPRPFPTPIRCEWVIHNPHTMKTVLYFTQFYLKGHFHVWEFDHYTNSEEYIGPRKLATINFQERVNSVTVYKPYVVIRFSVSDIGNVHARVLEHLIDVYGFNITYEFVERQKTDVKRTCSLHLCSYLGNCYASADYSSYRCECFDGYFGEECQFGPHCDPANGINICHNGGVCRYFQGSFVNMCNCTERFTGDQCLIPKTDYKLDICTSMGCEHSCNPAARTCSCIGDFRLNEDNRTCSHIDRNNVFVKLRPTIMYIQNASISGNFPRMGLTVVNALGDDVGRTLAIAGVNTFSKFEVEGYSVSKNIWLSFRFRIEDNDISMLHSIMENIKKSSKIGSIPFVTDSLEYRIEPELFLKTVVSGNSQIDNYGNYATEGKFLTLSCIARGPANTEFTWYKDGKPIRLDLSARDGYQTIIPSSKEQTIRSVLHLEHVVPLDRGQFTCQVKDSITAYNASIFIDVISYPLVDIDPLASSVPTNGSTYLICLSPHDTLNTFKYEWYENGAPIHAGRSDKIPEDLIPTGSLLYIRFLERSSNFTCKVTNSAGAVNVTSSIYVQPAELSNETCDQDFHDKVFWKTTAGRHYDKQRCPAEAGGEMLTVSNSEGYATRRCKCKQRGKACTWEQPNFSECQSLRLVRSYDMLESLRLGYQYTTVKRIFDKLNRYVKKTRQQFYSGDSEMAASILRKLLQYMTDYPALSRHDQKISFITVINLMDLLVDFADNSSLEEKRNLHVGQNVLGTYDLLATDLINQLQFTPNLKVTSRNIDMAIENIYGSEKLPGGEILLNVHSNREKRNEPEKWTIMRYISRRIKSLLSHGDSQIGDLHVISEIYSLYPFPTNNYSSHIIYADLAFELKEMASLNANHGEYICMALNMHERVLERHTWENKSCTTISFDENFVKCRCNLPGHFIVTFKPITIEEEIVISDVQGNGGEITLLVGCIISLCGIVATLLVYLVNWRKLSGEEYIIHLNFLLALVCINIVFIVSLSAPNVQILCTVNQVLLYLFFLAAIAFLFADCIHTFIVTSHMHDDRKYFIKYLIIGWGIPVIISAFFIAASELFGRNNSKLCWISKNHWEFYAFLLPVLVLFLSMIIVVILSVKYSTTMTEELRYRIRRKILIKSGKSFTLFLLLIIVALLLVDLHSNQINPQSILLIIFEFLLTLTVFLLRGLFDIQILNVCWTCLPGHLKRKDAKEKKRKTSNSSFKAYIKPEKLQLTEVDNQEEKFHKHYEEVNRTKFTRERKRHLSSLLGSSTGSSLMDSVIGRPDTYQDFIYNRHEEGMRENNCTDSGVGSENDKFLGNYSSNSSMSNLHDEGGMMGNSSSQATDHFPLHGMISHEDIMRIDQRLEAVTRDGEVEEKSFQEGKNGHIPHDEIPLVQLKTNCVSDSDPHLHEESVKLLNCITKSAHIM